MTIFKTTTVAGIIAAGFATAAISADYNLNLSTSQVLADPLVIAMQGAKERIEERSDGAMTVTIYPSSQLGEDNDVLEQIRGGAPIAVLVDAGRLAPFKGELGILAAPYLVDDYSQYPAITESPVYEGWVDELAESSGIRLLNYNWFQGTRQMFSKKLVEKPPPIWAGGPGAHHRRAELDRHRGCDGRHARADGLGRGSIPRCNSAPSTGPRHS